MSFDGNWTRLKERQPIARLLGSERFLYTLDKVKMIIEINLFCVLEDMTFLCFVFGV